MGCEEVTEESVYEELVSDHKVLEVTINHVFKTQGTESESLGSQ